MTCNAGDINDDTEVFYRQSHSAVDLNYDSNRKTIDTIVAKLQLLTESDSLFALKCLKFIGTASPEGTVAYNNYLSGQRADNMMKYIKSAVTLPDSLRLSSEAAGRNWVGLYVLVDNDPNVPARSEVMAYLTTVLDDFFAGQSDNAAHLEGLKMIDGGQAYDYMYNNMFPKLRESIIHIEYEFKPYEKLQPLGAPVFDPALKYAMPDTELIPVGMSSNEEHNFYMALKTNMLYDALALPSLSAEFYLGKDFSIVGNWTYGWWDTDRRHRYWRAYGGDVAVRWWFGSKAKAKPLTGHHIGVYGGIFTYDFEFGGRGHMGGKPGHSLWDKCLLNCGIEYGYSLPVSSRLNIDFTIGIGYISGQYYEYLPQDGHYVWQSTHNLNWFGPAKAEISLVWLIGHGNSNSKKGGRQ